MKKVLISLVFMTLTGTTLADFIVGGTEVEGNKWENVVAITDNEGNIFCSGTALDTKTIKTAAHCLVNQQLSDMVANKLKPFFIAIDNPEMTVKEMEELKYDQTMIDAITVNQEAIKDNPENSTDLRESQLYRFAYIYTSLESVFKRFAQGIYRVHVGSGKAGGKVEASEYTISDIKISKSYLNEHVLQVASNLGLKFSDPELAMFAMNTVNEKDLDNATIIVEKELPITNFVPSITPEEVKEIDYKTVQLVGFGLTVDPNIQEEDENFGVKREVTVDFLSFTTTYNNFVTQSPNKSACYGDSGGSAFVKLLNGEWRYLGVISGGIGLQGMKGLEVTYSKNKEDGYCGSSKVATLIVPAYL